MNKLFGYARVSTESQNLDMQFDLLENHGVARDDIFFEKESGKKTDRKELEKLFMTLREGDKVIFYDLFRVGRNLKHLISLVETLQHKKVHFKDLTLPLIDSESVRTTNGEFMFYLFGAIGHHQRRSIVDKVNAGLASYRKRGGVCGRPKGLSAKLKEKAPRVEKLYLQTDMSIREISETLVMAPNSVYKCLKHQGVKIKLDTNRAIKNKEVA